MEDPAMKTINEFVIQEQQAAKKIRIEFRWEREIERKNDTNDSLSETIYGQF